MEYRTLPHTGQQISVIGMGSTAVAEQTEKDMIATVTYALDQGINYFDMAGARASIFPAYGKALEGRRKDAMLQVHFGPDYSSGEYGWCLELEKIKRSVDFQLKNLKTDYMDFGFIHCLDEDSDLTTYEENGVMDFVMEMKKQGVIRRLGFSTHAPHMANVILDRKIIDILMFSINPMYDYGQGEYARGTDDERHLLYRRCEKEGVGISVMKPFNAGQLLDAKKSPFHQALTTTQCIQYCLDKPGVVTVLPGAGSIQELEDVLTYFKTSKEERDYSVIGSFAPDTSQGRCVYCKHCHPCPKGLDIGLINKYYDLTRQGDVLAKEHYLTLEKTAQDCVQCGHCNSRCPFQVDQIGRMKEIYNFFGK